MNPLVEQKNLLTTNRKALTINLDPARYGTFAEIGAGQEVARVFFQAGGAAGTVAKTISAYDMTFSDAIYGKAPRYVSHERLSLMLDHEYALLDERLSASRGSNTAFFVFADTVSARSYKGNNECHGWIGVRFQTAPGRELNDVILHVRMWDKENVLQQQALGIVGVNLLYAAFYLRDNLEDFIVSLVDNVGTARIEVDMLKFSGPAFHAVDNRLMSLFLVKHGLTNAVMFSPGGDVLQPSEVLYKKPILVERGSFRPPTRVNIDMLECARAQFVREPAVAGREIIVLMEITMNNLLATGSLDASDFLARVDLLGELGLPVLISNYSEYHRLTTYFRRYTKEMIGVAMGINNLIEVFNEKYYENLEGGILESFGRLFRNAVRLYVYPMQRQACRRFLPPDAPGFPDDDAGSAPDTALVDARNVAVPEHLRNLYAHLLGSRLIEGIEGCNTELLGIFSRDVLQRIKSGDTTWEDMVPAPVAASIKARGLFCHHPPAP